MIKLSPVSRESPAAEKALVTLLGALFVLPGGIWLLSYSLNRSDGGQVAFSAVLVLFGLGFGVYGLVWAIRSAIRSAVVRRAFAEPILAVSQDKLRVGEEFEVTYQQRLRREAVVRSVAVRLILRETAVYSGYDSAVHTHDETAQEFEWRTLQGPILSGQATFRIPDDAMHSVRGKKNRLEWLVLVQVDLASGPRFKEEYEITVLPERVA